ncbi:PfkB family carbohydrate kinase [Geodermatophilus sp. YIM 151500]|uniref:PfkB family carbohydrate kinase n=1 Tax=Geodermatophilus sp. YIM 151500 TaxID=2984531 RepID=UPI0021E484F3|nr:PfkB family carbohydrate kinase [Geodermatophilus sp. YIM 151500]MCV2489143.1 PfkB family carbohydrate kinase [Geodermatophilus sp. YIM 151500]
MTHPPTGPAEPPGPETAFVFAPSPLLTITIENGVDENPEIHLHAGGQGFWLARMLTILGIDTTMAGAFGGETGFTLDRLIAAEKVRVRSSPCARPNGSYIHDRRSGDREPLVNVPPPTLTRHEVDELYTGALAVGLDADVAALGGPDTLGVTAPESVPPDTYRRLAADLRAVEVPVVADLSGPPLDAALEGHVTVLKASHEDLVDDGRADSEEPAALVKAMRAMAEQGAEAVVISRAGDPTLALVDGDVLEIEPPPLQLADHRGAGDSMTAGIAAALARGADLVDALRLGAAAGALNVTRRGLATGQRDVIERLAKRVDVRRAEEG